MEKYLDTMAEIGKPLVRLKNVYVQPFSGRVMGLCPREALNVLWLHPGLDSRSGAEKLVSGEVWTNLGGDRTWLSPELELFITDLARPMETYRPPPAFDPGDYRVLSRTDDAIEMETAVKVRFYRSGSTEEFVLNKRITVLDAPDFPLPSGVAAAGYSLRCRLTAMTELSSGVCPAIWNLLQVPGGGEIVVPRRDRAVPVAFFGRQQYEQDDSVIRASVPVASDAYKFGIRPEYCRGVMLYLQLKAAQPYMIVRLFDVGWPEDYCDVPFTDPSQPACAQQIYVDDGSYGGFGELEYHSPVMVAGGESCITDVCTTWAFSGPVESLRQLADRFIVG